MSAKAKIWLFFAMVVIPAFLVATTASVSFDRAKTVQFCASCHVMNPYIDDLRDPASENLAAKHYKNRSINQNQCYICHVNYDFLGPIDSKIRGLRHMVSYYGGHKKPTALFKPYPNSNCLYCHREAQKYKDAPTHEPLAAQIDSDEISCVSCHGPMHPHGDAQ